MKSVDVIEKVGLMLNRNVKIAKGKDSSADNRVPKVPVKPVKKIVEPEDHDIKKQ